MLVKSTYLNISVNIIVAMMLTDCDDNVVFYWDKLHIFREGMQRNISTTIMWQACDTYTYIHTNETVESSFLKLGLIIKHGCNPHCL